jgi:hypothetical protein
MLPAEKIAVRKALMDLASYLRRVPANHGSEEYKKGYAAGLDSAARMASNEAEAMKPF